MIPCFLLSNIFMDISFSFERYRPNHPSETISDYFRDSLTIPFLDNLLRTMGERFQPTNLALYSGFNLLPPVMRRNDKWKEDLKPFLETYLHTISDKISSFRMKIIFSH